MPDILRVTTPLIDKNQPVHPKPSIDALNSFQLQDASKVLQAHNQTELMQQNTGTLEGGEAPTLLLNLLKDPAVTVTYLKNIFLLEEIFKLLPANNTPVTPEIEQLFHQLLVNADDILPEMLRQETASTAFKGELFDFLRQLSDTKSGSPETQFAIANFLKSVNNFLCRDDILDAVSNSLQYLKEALAASESLSSRLDQLAASFQRPGAAADFPSLKAQTLALFKDIEDSILFSPKLSKVLSITIYNLSRYNDSTEFFSESLYRLRQLLSGEDRSRFTALTDRLVADLMQGKLPGQEGRNAGSLQGKLPVLQGESLIRQGGGEGFVNGKPQGESRVMDSLIKLVGMQSDDKSMNAADAAKVDKILHSLLSSPCNFTPLLHFIVPVIQDQMRAFAEIWINPRSDEKDMPPGAGKGTHFLLVIDVEGLGRFEAELFVHGETVDLNLYCPPGFESPYREMMGALPKTFAALPYRLGNTRVEPLERSRSLMDVFKSLPYKRVGVDVKI